MELEQKLLLHMRPLVKDLVTYKPLYDPYKPKISPSRLMNEFMRVSRLWWPVSMLTIRNVGEFGVLAHEVYGNLQRNTKPIEHLQALCYRVSTLGLQGYTVRFLLANNRLPNGDPFNFRDLRPPAQYNDHFGATAATLSMTVEGMPAILHRKFTSRQFNTMYTATLTMDFVYKMGLLVETTIKNKRIIGVCHR